jgi:CheY-like chemotaxis protein
MVIERRHHAMEMPGIAQQPQRAKLLFVEGDAAERERNAALLSEYFEVTAAADGESALVLLAGCRFDVLCAAADAPAPAGRELLARAAALPQAPRGVLLTAQIGEEGGLVDSVGFQVVFKPYELQQLIDTVHREYTLARMRLLLPA